MAHIHAKIDLVAEAFIVYRNTVLLRKHDKYNLWTGPGGHIELDEDPNQAVIREVKEEVGIDIELAGGPFPFKDMPDEKELIPPRFMNRHRINPTHEHVSLIYLARTQANRITENDQEKSKELRWCTKTELEDTSFDLHPHIRHYALTALEELGT